MVKWLNGLGILKRKIQINSKRKWQIYPPKTADPPSEADMANVKTFLKLKVAFLVLSFNM